MDWKEFIKNHKNSVIIAVTIIFALVFLWVKIIPSLVNVTKLKSNYESAKKTHADKERFLNDLKAKSEETKTTGTDLVRPFYKSIDKNLDTEVAIENEFGEILALLRSNSIKTRSVSYEYDPADDVFVSNVGDEFNVAQLKLEMIGTYKNFEGLLKELFKHEHFLDIVSFEITPYEKNKRILLINMQIKLYAQKG